MRIAILSRNPSLYSTRRLVKACEQRDHTVDVLNTLKCYRDLPAHLPAVHYQEKERNQTFSPSQWNHFHPANGSRLKVIFPERKGNQF